MKKAQFVADAITDTKEFKTIIAQHNFTNRTAEQRYLDALTEKTLLDKNSIAGQTLHYLNAHLTIMVFNQPSLVTGKPYTVYQYDPVYTLNSELLQSGDLFKKLENSDRVYVRGKPKSGVITGPDSSDLEIFLFSSSASSHSTPGYVLLFIKKTAAIRLMADMTKELAKGTLIVLDEFNKPIFVYGNKVETVLPLLTEQMADAVTSGKSINDESISIKGYYLITGTESPLSRYTCFFAIPVNECAPTIGILFLLFGISLLLDFAVAFSAAMLYSHHLTPFFTSLKESSTSLGNGSFQFSHLTNAPSLEFSHLADAYNTLQDKFQSVVDGIEKASFQYKGDAYIAEKSIASQDQFFAQNIDRISSVSIDDLVDSKLSPQKSNLLLVDDNLEMLFFLKSNLENSYNLFFAFNGEHALTKLKNIPRPDLIISDIVMEVLDGYQFLQQLLKTVDLQDIPLIFLTAKTTVSEKIKGISEGAIDYIYKPFLIEELSAKIDSFISNQIRLRTKNISLIKNSIEEALYTIDSGGSVKKEDVMNNEINFLRIQKKYKLSSRELDVIKPLSKGLFYKEIAGELGISKKTVEHHIYNLYKKIGVQSKFELLIALQQLK